MTKKREVVDSLRRISEENSLSTSFSLEAITHIGIDDRTVRIDLDPSATNDQQDLQETIEAEIEDLDGVEHVDLNWNSSPESDPHEEVFPNIQHIIAVSSGKGGVGKTTVAVNLAVALANRDNAVGLLDGDVYGPNVPRMIGGDTQPQLDSDGSLIPPEEHGVNVMSMGYLTGQTPVVWRGPMVHQGLSQLLLEVNWGTLDYLVVDLPPGTGDAQLTVAQTIPVTGAVVVTTPQGVALDDSLKSIEMFKDQNIPIAGIVENMTSFVCTECETLHDLFRTDGAQKLAERTDVPVLGRIPFEPAVPRESDAGAPVVIDEAADRTLATEALLETADAIERRVRTLAGSKVQT